MKHIKKYVDKIEKMIAKELESESKPRSKGLLASKTDKKTSQDKPNELDIIVRYVTGIRKAKEEMINDRK